MPLLLVPLLLVLVLLMPLLVLPPALHLQVLVGLQKSRRTKSSWHSLAWHCFGSWDSLWSNTHTKAIEAMAQSTKSSLLAGLRTIVSNATYQGIIPPRDKLNALWVPAKLPAPLLRSPPRQSAYPDPRHGSRGETYNRLSCFGCLLCLCVLCVSAVCVCKLCVFCALFLSCALLV